MQHFTNVVHVCRPPREKVRAHVQVDVLHSIAVLSQCSLYTFIVVRSLRAASHWLLRDEHEA